MQGIYIHWQIAHGPVDGFISMDIQITIIRFNKIVLKQKKKHDEVGRKSYWGNPRRVGMGKGVGYDQDTLHVHTKELFNK